MSKNLLLRFTSSVAILSLLSVLLAAGPADAQVRGQYTPGIYATNSADSFFEPIVLGWHLKRADIRAGYAFIPPTGRFVPGSTTNIGAGYWANCPFAGETVYLTKNKATTLSGFEIYEFHTEQTGTEVHPGQTITVDYSLMQAMPFPKKSLLQFGLVGYGQWQTTDKTGATPVQNALGRLHYGVLGLGADANVILPERKVTLGFKYFQGIPCDVDCRRILAADFGRPHLLNDRCRNETRGRRACLCSHSLSDR